MGPVDTYYKYLEEIRVTKDYEKLIELCKQSLPLLEALVKEMKRDYGSFDITSIPAIEKGSIYAAVFGNDDVLRSMKAKVDEIPELAPWKKVVKEGFQIMDISMNIEDFVKANPGYQQKKLKLAVGIEDGRLVSRIVHYLENVGKIRRQRNGSTYDLFIS